MLSLTACARRIGMLATAILIGGSSLASAEVLKNTATGRVPLKSIDVISFAPEGVLLIGDGRGAQVLAVATGDVKPGARLTKKIDQVAAKFAGRLGVPTRQITILDMAVNPLSGTAYFAIRKQDDKTYVVLTVNGAGEIGECRLDSARYAQIALRSGEAQVRKITDVAWADDRVIAAGASNETFSSKIFSIDAPLRHQFASAAYSAETYHVSHRRWETKAPMSVVIPLKENGKTYVVGAFSCTPIVKYPLDSVQPGAKVQGSSMIELGSGNRPLNMFVYEKDGKQYVLCNTYRFHHKQRPFGPSPLWTVRFEQDLLLGKKGVNEEATRRLNRKYEPIVPTIKMIEAYHGVRHMDRLDATHALVIRETEQGSSLEPLPLP